MKTLEDFLDQKVTVNARGNGFITIISGILQKNNGHYLIRESGGYICWKADTKFMFNEGYYEESGTAYFYLREE